MANGPDDVLGSQSLFITGEKLSQIKATKEVPCVSACVRVSACTCVCVYMSVSAWE